LQLLTVLQHINFGRIELLVIRGGEPVLDPMPRRVREIKIGGENGPRRELGAADFHLKHHVVELFAFFDASQDGVIDVLKIQNGLPVNMTFTEVSA
jgi:hypothetical protein